MVRAENMYMMAVRGGANIADKIANDRIINVSIKIRHKRGRANSENVGEGARRYALEYN